MTLQSRAISRQSSSSAPGNGRRLLATYRNLLASVIDLERELVEMELLKPEERRVLSREERRAGGSSTNGRD